MRSCGFQLLFLGILCITIVASKSINCGESNTFLNSKSIACRGSYGGTYIPPTMSGNDGSGTNGGGNAAQGGSTSGNGGAGAMPSITNMASTMMRTAEQARDAVMNAMSNMNPMG